MIGTSAAFPDFFGAPICKMTGKLAARAAQTVPVILQLAPKKSESLAICPNHTAPPGAVPGCETIDRGGRGRYAALDCDVKKGSWRSEEGRKRIVVWKKGF